MNKFITGEMFKNALISGAANIYKNRQAVDELNVFPVPDGDTGTNMSMTANNASRVIERMGSESIEKTSAEASSAFLRGARGNSGVILSLLFRGIAKGFRGVEEADAAALSIALNKGVEAAYKAVMKPTEGTILTVARVSAEAAEKASEENDNAVEVFEVAVEAAKEALAQTTEMLPALKKAGVVDAGGQGLVYIYEGMLSCFKTGEVISEKGNEAPAAVAAESPSKETVYTYSAEYTVKRDRTVETDTTKLKAFLESIGDCVNVDESADEIKVYCRSDNPGKVIQQGLKYGMLVNIKIENILEQSGKTNNAAPVTTSDGAQLTPAPIEKKYGFVAVAAGEGICQLFEDLGVDNIVKGGQTMNPSTDDILCAVEQTPAEIVFVLPNNKNIIMAAEQAIPLATRKVAVLPTTSIPMGISAMLAFNEEADENGNILEMTKAADRTGTGLITYAARNSSFDGKVINEGEILALKNGKITFVEKDIVKAVYKLVRQLVGRESRQITLFYGNNIDLETVNEVTALLEEKFEGVEITVAEGGQPVYYFIISVE